MKKLLNTLYVTTQGAWLGKDGRNVVVRVEGRERGRAPVHLLGQIICFGHVGMSPELMHFCAEEGVTITFLSSYGRFLGRVEGPVRGNVLLRRAQHQRTADAEPALPVARHIVAAKLANQRGVLARALRDHGGDLGAEDRKRLEDGRTRLRHLARRALHCRDMDSLRGLEGEGADIYWHAFPLLLRNAQFQFEGRSRRPPRDCVNALLSFLYVLLAADCRAAAEAQGLDPQMGFLHRDRPGRASLALDLMEEFRAPVADRLTLSLLNRGQLRTGHFTKVDTGAVYLDEDGRRIVLEAWQERKRRMLRHAFLEETVPVGLMPFLQAQLLARHLRGDLDAYPAYVWR